MKFIYSAVNIPPNSYRSFCRQASQPIIWIVQKYQSLGWYQKQNETATKLQHKETYTTVTNN